MTEREIYKKFGNLIEDELNTKSNKNVRLDVMSTIIKRCRDGKKRRETKINGFRKKLMILETEISECPEFEVESKIGNRFVNEKI